MDQWFAFYDDEKKMEYETPKNEMQENLMLENVLKEPCQDKQVVNGFKKPTLPNRVLCSFIEEKNVLPLLDT